MGMIHKRADSLVFDTRPIVMQNMSCRRASLGKREWCAGHAVGVSAVLGGDSFWVSHVAVLCFDHVSLLQNGSTVFSKEERIFQRGGISVAGACAVVVLASWLDMYHTSTTKCIWNVQHRSSAVMPAFESLLRGSIRVKHRHVGCSM